MFNTAKFVGLTVPCDVTPIDNITSFDMEQYIQHMKTAIQLEAFVSLWVGRALLSPVFVHEEFVYYTSKDYSYAYMLRGFVRCATSDTICLHIYHPSTDGKWWHGWAVEFMGSDEDGWTCNDMLNMRQVHKNLVTNLF